MPFRIGKNSQCAILAWALTEARVSLKCFPSEWKGQVWLFYSKKRWSIYLCWLKFPILPFHPSTKFEAERSFQRIRKCWLQEPVTTQLCAFSRPVTEERSAEQLAQICILWLIPGGSQITDSIWMLKKLNFCWELLTSSLLLVFTELSVPLSVLHAFFSTLPSLLLGCLLGSLIFISKDIDHWELLRLGSA